MEFEVNKKSTFEELADDVKKIRKAIQQFEAIGINQELMIMYINKKSKVGINNIKAVLNAQKAFFDEAVTSK